MRSRAKAIIVGERENLYCDFNGKFKCISRSKTIIIYVQKQAKRRGCGKPILACHASKIVKIIVIFESEKLKLSGGTSDTT